MKKQTVTIVVIVIIILILLAVFNNRKPVEVVSTPTPSVAQATTTVENITSNISADTKITSPLTITGSAPGNWFFEASFPIKLLDANGKVLAQTNAQATTDWMVSGPVTFKATLTFPKPTTSSGSIVFHNDNPSGDPARDKSFTIPVLFDLGSQSSASVKTTSSVITDVKIGPTGK